MKKRFDQYGRISKTGKYDQYGNLIKKESLINRIKNSIHDYKQKRMIIPTDPKEIKLRANQIRQEINEQKNKRIELASLNEDLELIKFHARIKGKLKLDDELSYEDQREKSDTKDLIDKNKKNDWYISEDD